MSKPLDRFFREKLANHQVTPNEAAWSKVEASLHNKKKGVIWYRAAAAIVLLGTLTITILLVRSGEEKKDTIANVDTTRVIPKEKVTPSLRKTQKVDQPKLPVVKSPSRKVNVYIAHEEIKKEADQPVEQKNVVALVEEIPQPIVQKEQLEVKPVKRAIVLTYTLAPIPTQQQRSVAVDTKSGLQKMAGIALDVKNSEGALAELRTLKNDLFALNFKRETESK